MELLVLLIEDTMHVVVNAKKHVVFTGSYNNFSQANAGDIPLIYNVADQKLGSRGE